MVNIILKHKTLINLYWFLVKTFRFMNKHLYILPILSFIIARISKIRGNTFYKIISWIVKIIILVNIILGTGFIIYFWNPSEGVSIYYQLLQTYIDLITNFFKGLWIDLSNINIEDSFIDNVNAATQQSNNIKIQIQQGIKAGVKEALDEVISELQENLDAQVKSDLLKQFALITGALFIGYFLFILPINPVDLNQYNWLNQSLIELKIILLLPIKYFYKCLNILNHQKISDILILNNYFNSSQFLLGLP